MFAVSEAGVHQRLPAAYRREEVHPAAGGRRRARGGGCDQRAEPVSGRVRKGVPARVVLRRRVSDREEVRAGGDRLAGAICGRPRAPGGDRDDARRRAATDGQESRAGGERPGVADCGLRPGAQELSRDGVRGAAPAGGRAGLRHSELPAAARDPARGDYAARKHGRRIRHQLHRGQDGVAR